MSNEKDLIYLDHIWECVTAVQSYTAKGKDDFFANRLVQDAVLRRLQIMSESIQRLSDDVKQQAPDLDWRD